MTTDPHPTVAISPLLVLLGQRAAAKQAEDQAIAARRAIDAKIIAAIDKPASGEGTSSRLLTHEDGTEKITVSYGVDRKVDTEAVKTDHDKLPAAVQAVFRWKAELDTKAYKALASDDALVAAKYVTAKPSTPSVKVEQFAVN